MSTGAYQAVVLAGGLGTRIKGYTQGKIPKPMLQAAQRPFLAYVLDWLAHFQVEHVVLAIGFQGQVIRDHFGNRRGDIHLTYADEGEHLLDTGGAIKNALQQCDPDRPAFVLNGDTIFPIDLHQLSAFHLKQKQRFSGPGFSLALKQMVDSSRFGTVTLEPETHRITSFHEKRPESSGLINGGVYCLDPRVVLDIPEQRFSIERDFLHKQKAPLYGLPFNRPFYDIGTPADYETFRSLQAPRIQRYAGNQGMPPWPIPRLAVTYPNSFLGGHLTKGLADTFQLEKMPEGLSPDQMKAFLHEHQIEVLVLNIPFSGGIELNIQQPATLMVQNLRAALDHITAAADAGLKRLIFIGSSCMYPSHFERPISENDLFSGPLEPTNAAYATANLAAMQLCQAFSRQHGLQFTTVIPANLYGDGDDFDPQTGHVIGALINRFHTARENGDTPVSLWGTGKPIRDFLYAGDFVEALRGLLLVEEPPPVVNIGSGGGYSIKTIAETIRRVTGFAGEMHWDEARPDGMPIKILDSGLLHRLNIHPPDDLEQGIQKTYRSYLGAKTTCFEED